VAGLVPGLSAVRSFFRHKTTLIPGGVSSHLVTEGVYRFTRNPMYVGMTVVLAGAAMLFGSLTPWLLVPLFVLAIDRDVIPFEEAVLVAAFGEEYRHYQSRVRRWI
jgi:protein-S-isoprenylcysteine O-methyltransferase Ste14